jgi:signal recognition particle receptor subunit beta
LNVHHTGFDTPPLQREADVAAPVPRVERRKALIGASLEDARGRLSSLTEQLEEHLEEYAAPLLAEAQKQLRQATCRIAIIGQVKAGKSTFINALVQQPGLLPTDINPCTAVVTLLQFRKGAPPEHAAVFRLFSSDEWSNLAEGGGILRELTERLVPSFRPELLRVQLEFMRKRAERRLGPSFQELLGQCHGFKEITPNLLADYVSAEDDHQPAAGSGRQRYSDITRTAELFLSQGPFAFPTTLIDTPGTNDPFLVRDEITRRCLENPDIFVFVLSALQPPSASDMAMLRLLNGLHKDRIVVFINRADQLADPTGDRTAVKSLVEQRLRREFPALDIPVVVGSAWLGNLGLRLQQGDLRAGLDPSHQPLLRRVGLPAGAILGRLTNAERSRMAAAMYESSGMAEISAAITRLMNQGGSAILFRQIAACLIELVRSADISANAELNSIERLLAARRTEAATLGARIAEEQKSLSVFEERAGAIKSTFEQIEAHLTDLIAFGTEALRVDLHRIVRSFSDEQSELMLQLSEVRNPGTTLGCNVMPLRDRLEAAYLASFEHMAAELVRVESFLYPQLQIIVAKLLPDCHRAFIEPPTAPLQPIPSAPLSATVALDLGAPWWKLWFAARRSPQERAEHLGKLIEDEFHPVVEALVDLAETRLSERAGYTIGRANAISAGMLVGIERRRSLLAAERGLLDGVSDKPAMQRLEREQAERATACRQTRAACAVYSEELARLASVLEHASREGDGS